MCQSFYDSPHREESAVIDLLIEDHGFTTFALAYALVTAHDESEVTIQQVTAQIGLSVGAAYDVVEAVYAIDDSGSTQPAPVHAGRY